MMNNDTRCRKYNITINNPIEHGYSHEKIKRILSTSNYIYFCMCDEIGSEKHIIRIYMFVLKMLYTLAL